MQGKLAPVKAKLETTFRTIFLMEYFKTITKFATKNIHKDLSIFEHFSHAQRSDWEDWTGSTPRKHAEFLEMVLFTLPEKLNETIFFEKEDPFLPFNSVAFSGHQECFYNTKTTTKKGALLISKSLARLKKCLILRTCSQAKLFHGTLWRTNLLPPSIQPSL